MPTVYNKVTINGTTYMDLSQDTVADASHIRSGYVGHLNDGTQVTGTYSGSGSNVFVVTVSKNQSTDYWEPDCTYADVLAAHSANKTITVQCDNASTNYSADGYFTGSSLTYKVFEIGEYGTNPYYVLVKEQLYDFDSNGISLSENYVEYDTSDADTTASDVLNGKIFYNANGRAVGSIQTKTSSDLTASGATVTVPAGYYASQATKSVASGTAGTPTATKGSVSNHSIAVTPSVTNTSGYITGSTKTGTAVTVSASELVSGSQTLTTNDTYDVTNLASVVVNVSGGSSWQTLYDGSITISSGTPNYFIITNYTSPFLANETYRVTWGGTPYTCETIEDTTGTSYDGNVLGNTYIVGFGEDTGEPFFMYRDSATRIVGIPTGSVGSVIAVKIEKQIGGGSTLITKTITADGTYDAEDDNADGYSSVTVNVPTGTARTSTDVTVSGDSVTVPAGLYSSSVTKSVASGSAGTPTASKGTVSNHSVSVTPSVTNTTGYITGGAKTGTAVTVSASELVSGSETKTANGTYDVTNLAELVVNVASSGGVNIDTKTATASNYPVSLSFTSMKGEPKAFFLRSTSQISSSGNTTYYYIIDMRYNGTDTTGNCFRIGSTRRVDNITSGYSYSYSGTTLTITSSAASRSASPGAFNNTYELVYIY